jgi:hypothetical protein
MYHTDLRELVAKIAEVDLGEQRAHRGDVGTHGVVDGLIRVVVVVVGMVGSMGAGCDCVSLPPSFLNTHTQRDTDIYIYLIYIHTYTHTYIYLYLIYIHTHKHTHINMYKYIPAHRVTPPPPSTPHPTHIHIYNI